VNKLLRKALFLAILTVSYNILEGFVSVIFGADDETLALFGFGLDSFVEVISGIGILHLIFRMNYGKVEQRDKFEKTALKITGFAFYLLAAGLVAGAILIVVNNVKPDTTIPGIIISLISIFTMYYLMNAKLKVGRELNSDAIIADANCTKTCFYLSFILLASSGLYELFKINYIDALGSIGIAYFAFTEGREAFEKVRTGNLLCSCGSETEIK
jgi:divalent metal cation (Fe/Co/Zn/Cd) transporter